MNLNQNKTKEIIEKIFQPSTLNYGLNEFSDFDIESILKIEEKEKSRYYLKDIKTGKDRFIYDDEKKTSRPEEVVRQLWLYKLNKHYKYPFERIAVEKSVSFGREVRKKAADIIVFKKDKITPYIIIEVKKPDIKKGLDQLKSYLSAEGSEIGVWSNGNEKVILYRPYPKEFEDSLNEIPRADQTIDDLFEEKKVWSELDPKFDFVEIVKQVEELALAGSGANVFEEIFKIIYAKLYDEKMARERRDGEEVIFRKYRDPQKTYDVVNDELFKEAIKQWPDVFEVTDKIRLSPQRLNVCVPLMENIRLFEIGQGELEIIDSAFEYLITEVSKGKKGQYFTPRNVVKMCVEMFDPKADEYVIDPAAGSGGFLLHSMYHVWDKYLKSDQAKKDYAAKYIYGVDFDDNMRRISQALMLIAGDGKHHIFKRNSLDARDWQGSSAVEARAELKPLLADFDNPSDRRENEKTYRYLNFDVVLTNPPFAGENPDQGVLRQYDLAKKDGKLKNNVERHILFVERALDMLKPGGRMAIVLPQGVFNNTTMEYIREWLFDKAKILAVVGLHENTFKPHTGTKTSVLFLQKWRDKKEQDYPIFMATSEKSGKNNSGDYVYKKDEHGNPKHDQGGRKIIDDDLDEIVKGFKDFVEDNNIKF
jgi:type I restriction enzyme M protein